jgi:hypothetical protein
VTSIGSWSTTISSAAIRATGSGARTLAQALRDALGVTELPPLVSPEREQLEPTAA